MEDKLKEMEKAMARKLRELEAKMEVIDRRSEESSGKSKHFNGAAQNSQANNGTGMSGRVEALESCLEQVLEMMFPHVDAILSELEKRIPADHSHAISPPAPTSTKKGKQSSTTQQIRSNVNKSKMFDSVICEEPSRSPIKTKAPVLTQQETSGDMNSTNQPQRDFKDRPPTRKTPVKTTGVTSSAEGMKSKSDELIIGTLTSSSSLSASTSTNQASTNKVHFPDPSKREQIVLPSSQNTSKSNIASSSDQNLLGTSSFKEIIYSSIHELLQPELTSSAIAAHNLANERRTAGSPAQKTTNADSQTMATVSTLLPSSNDRTSSSNCQLEPTTPPQRPSSSQVEHPAFNTKTSANAQPSGVGIAKVEMAASQTINSKNSTNADLSSVRTASSGSSDNINPLITQTLFSNTPFTANSLSLTTTTSTTTLNSTSTATSSSFTPSHRLLTIYPKVLTSPVVVQNKISSSTLLVSENTIGGPSNATQHQNPSNIDPAHVQNSELRWIPESNPKVVQNTSNPTSLKASSPRGSPSNLNQHHNPSKPNPISSSNPTTHVDPTVKPPPSQLATRNLPFSHEHQNSTNPISRHSLNIIAHMPPTVNHPSSQPVIGNQHQNPSNPISRSFPNTTTLTTPTVNSPTFQSASRNEPFINEHQNYSNPMPRSYPNTATLRIPTVNLPPSQPVTGNQHQNPSNPTARFTPNSTNFTASTVNLPPSQPVTGTQPFTNQHQNPSQIIDHLQSKNPLVRAAVSGTEADVAAVLRWGSNINSADAYGQTALHWAAWRGDHDIVRLLLNNGADASVRNAHSVTPLHLAAGSGHAQCAAFLVDAGADVNCTSKNQRTALHLAAAKGHEEVVNVLVAAGADRGAMDVDGRSAFDLSSTDAIREMLLT